MGLAGELKKRIEKQEKRLQEIMEQIDALGAEYREATAYMQALQDTFKLLPKEEQESESAPEITMRTGSLVAQARDALRKRGEPMHVNEILKAMGKDASSKKDRLSLSGSLALYVRKEQVFTRPLPNIFGLREWAKADTATVNPADHRVEVVDSSKTIIHPRPLTHRAN